MIWSSRGVLLRPLRSPWKIISFQKRIMTTNQTVIPRNFLQGWPRLRVNLLYSQAEHAACAVETRRHLGSDVAWRSSTRKNAPFARRAVNTSLSTPLTDAFGSVGSTV